MGITTVSATGNQILGAGSAAVGDGLTLIRLRGLFSIQLMSSTAAFDRQQGAFGIGIVRAEAFAIGVTAVPTPIADQDWNGWLYWTPYIVEANGASFEDSFRIIQEFTIDTKAMRKLNMGDTIYAVIENTESGSAPVAHTYFDSRILLKLP